MSNSDDGIWINAERFLEVSHGGGLEASGFVIDVVMGLWARSKRAVTSDPAKLSEQLHAIRPMRGYSPELVARLLPLTEGFLVRTKDGGLAPSADVFALNDPYYNAPGDSRP